MITHNFFFHAINLIKKWFKKDDWENMYKSIKIKLKT